MSRPTTLPGPWALTTAQCHAFGIIGGVAFGLERRTLVKLARELTALGLVLTGGAHSGHNRSAYHWELTAEGRSLLASLILDGAFPLANRTAEGRAILRTAEEVAS